MTRPAPFALAALAALVAAAGAAGAPAKRALAPAEHAWVPGELIVQFEPDATRSERRELHAARGATVKERIAALRIEVVKLPRGVSVREALRAYARDPDVALAEPNYVRYPLETVPDDSLFPHLWGLQNTGQEHALGDADTLGSGTSDADVDATDAWDRPAAQAPGPIVAVIDGGFYAPHPDLEGSLWTNPGEVARNGADDDRNGYKDDVHGWNFSANNATLTNGDGDALAHGTHVAGTIAAEMGNTAGVAGVCPTCKLMLLRIATWDGLMTLGAELAALAYAREMGAAVVNMSFGAPFFSVAERRAIAAARSQFLAVIAAGNESLDNDMYLVDNIGGEYAFSPSFPASYTVSNIVSVAATNHRDEYGYATGCYARRNSKARCAFTSWGHDSVDLAAPGVDIMSTVHYTTPYGRYDAFTGTSMAAPHVAGIAGLVKAQNPT